MMAGEPRIDYFSLPLKSSLIVQPLSRNISASVSSRDRFCGMSHWLGATVVVIAGTVTLWADPLTTDDLNKPTISYG